MPYPVPSKLVILWEVVWSRSVDMLEDLVEEVTDNHRTSKAAVWVPLKGFIEGAGFGHLAVPERCFGARKMRSYLYDVLD